MRLVVVAFATRIAPHVDAWTLCKIMGWASLSVAMRYVHPSEQRVLAAFHQSELSPSGDKTGDSTRQSASDTLLAKAATPAVASI